MTWLVNKHFAQPLTTSINLKHRLRKERITGLYNICSSPTDQRLVVISFRYIESYFAHYMCKTWNSNLLVLIKTQQAKNTSTLSLYRANKTAFYQIVIADESANIAQSLFIEDNRQWLVIWPAGQKSRLKSGGVLFRSTTILIRASELTYNLY